MTTLKLGGSPRGSRVSTQPWTSFLELTLLCVTPPPRLLQVAASEAALAYALTGGLIRVVNLENGDRTLLRSHVADVCDLQVCSHCRLCPFSAFTSFRVQVCGPDVLCSAAADGTVVFQQLDLARLSACMQSAAVLH